jgi:hypothetical protein
VWRRLECVPINMSPIVGSFLLYKDCVSSWGSSGAPLFQMLNCGGEIQTVVPMWSPRSYTICLRIAMCVIAYKPIGIKTGRNMI